VTVRHHPESTVAAMLLAGWLASRLDWQLERSQIVGRSGAGVLTATARRAAREDDSDRRDPPGDDASDDIALRLEVAPELQVPGLAGVELRSSSGLRVRLDRGTGGLRARRRDPDGQERTWTVLGASRGEAGILGEGIRQALLRDPTYAPALDAALAMAG
jgi:Glucose-6-phosphate dehydrogenase subunit